MAELLPKKKWPVYFFASDTTGEKPFEEFYTSNEKLVMDRYKGLGVIQAQVEYDIVALDKFSSDIANLVSHGTWSKAQILQIFCEILPEFKHEEKGKYLDERM